ncbi:hypothetical protein [uncultured Pelagimonas sp.]|uniref:hypothetical protein n=1 Tax=uncultured Pelagimonas sp. TaxID=1618102 RepID=UPI002635FAD7|nr:hypothetical protein [uncultured Pelagimonas sp.]
MEGTFAPVKPGTGLTADSPESSNVQELHMGGAMIEDLLFREKLSDLVFFALSNPIPEDVLKALVVADLRAQGEAATLYQPTFSPPDS